MGNTECLGTRPQKGMEPNFGSMMLSAADVERLRAVDRMVKTAATSLQDARDENREMRLRLEALQRQNVEYKQRMAPAEARAVA
mmetsp:Transcript_29509/g.78047  ORF Transcript_29509/g.78047 Transcript_29509/m.78047 type:complete len:84 (-) Transcript_29509:133-384(-)